MFDYKGKNGNDKHGVFFLGDEENIKDYYKKVHKETQNMGVSEGQIKYLEALRGDMVQRNLRNKVLPINFLAACIESGAMDCNDEALLFEIEKSFGQRLKPKKQPTMNLAKDAPSIRVSSTAGMPVVGASGDGTLPFEKSMPIGAMYAETVKTIDAKVVSKGTFEGRLFNQCIKYNARKDWCTPTLMRCLLMDPSYVEKLRAAMYPSMVSYCERTFTDGGKTYMVPYITITDESNMGVKCGVAKCEKEMRSATFYLNKNGQISMMAGHIKQMYDVSDFSSREAIKAYLKRLEAEFREENKTVPRSNMREVEKYEWKPVEDFLTPYATGRKSIGDPEQLMKDFMRVHKKALCCDTEDYFLNIKTGESYRTIIRNNIKEARREGNDWFKVADVTACVENGQVQRRLIAGEFERQGYGSPDNLREAATRDMYRLHRKMFGTVGNEESLGREEFDRECHRF